jgi:hypothetical protein
MLAHADCLPEFLNLLAPGGAGVREACAALIGTASLGRVSVADAKLNSELSNTGEQRVSSDARYAPVANRDRRGVVVRG